MKKTLTTLRILLLIILAWHTAFAEDLLHLKGNWLFYSFDHNYIFGKGNIRLNIDNIIITGDSIDMDISKKRCRITSNIIISDGKNNIKKCDMVDLLLDPIAYRSYAFKDKIEISGIEEGKVPEKFSKITLPELKESLLYFIGKEILIKKNLDVYGKDTTAFVEGIQSLTFRSFRLNKGTSDKNKTFSVNKLWYYNNTGILGDFTFVSGKTKKGTNFKTDNNLRVSYDLFDAGTAETDFRLDFKSSNSIILKEKNRLKLNLNYIKDNISQAILGYSFKNQNLLDGGISLDLKKRNSSKSELWIRSNLRLNLKNFGSLTLNYNYEISRDYLGNINYIKSFGKKLKFFMGTSFSGSRISDSSFNKISESRLNINYSTRIFNLSADYSLNRELLYKKSMSSPKLNLNFIPITFYEGILSINLSSTIISNNININGIRENEFRSNTVIGLSSKKIAVNRRTGIEFSLRTELLFDKNSSENYTSGGYVLKGTENLFKNTDIEITYNYYTRRRAVNWLIEGTVASDLTLLLKNRPKSGNSNFWASLSYDLDKENYTSSYLNFEILLIKQWYFQSLINYDFIFKNLNFNIYLERKAGRYKIRFSYRSLTKQFQMELIPN